MAQRNPIASDDISAEAARKELEQIASEQHIGPVTDFDSLKADFWPENERVDDFVRTVRDRRRSSGTRSVE